MNITRKKLTSLAAIAAAILSAPIQGQASTAFTIDNATGQILANPPFTLGFSFTANSAITVTGLGLFDGSQDGLVDSYEIGLFDSGGTLLASTTIQSGTASSLLDQFRYESITPTVLAPGDYSIGALFLTSSDELIFPGTAVNFATAPEITFLNASFAAGGTLAAPSIAGGSSSDPAYFGPNFTFRSSSSVPDAGSSALLVGLALGGLALVRQRMA